MPPRICKGGPGNLPWWNCQCTSERTGTSKHFRYRPNILLRMMSSMHLYWIFQQRQSTRFLYKCNSMYQRLCCRSGWSGQAGPLFSRSLVSFPDCTKCIYNMQLLVIWCIPLLAVVLLLSLALHVGLLRRLPTSPCLSRFRNNGMEWRTLCTGLYSQVGLILGSGCTTIKPPTLFYVICAQKLRSFLFSCILIPPSSFYSCTLPVVDLPPPQCAHARVSLLFTVTWPLLKCWRRLCTCNKMERG